MNTPVATIIFILTIYISHYYLDKYHQRLDAGLQVMRAWLFDTWLPIRLIFGAMISIMEILAKIVRAINTSRPIESLLPGAMDDLMLNPWRVLQEKKYHLLLTHGFIHANYLHLLVNMIAFWFFAFPLEQHIGSIPFLLVYIGALFIGGYITTYRRRFNQMHHSLGASGALSGVFLAVVLNFPDALVYLFFILPMRAWFAALLFMLFSFYAARPAQEKIYDGFGGQGGYGQSNSRFAALRYRYPLLDRIISNLQMIWQFIKVRSSFIDHESHFWGGVCGMVIMILLNPAVINIFLNRVF